jgi:hypothetical protein
MTFGTRRPDTRAGISRGVLVVAALAAAGCGQQSYPVALSFTLADGSPLTEGFATVQHTTDPAILGGGPITANGTCRPVLRGQSAPGLPAGTYRVGVTGAESQDFDSPAAPLPFESSYTNPADSGLTVTVGAGSPETTAFSLRLPH